MTKHRDLLAGALGALLATVLLGAVPLALRPDGIQFPDGSVQTTAAGARKFYLTPTLSHNGAQALSACAEGFQMASLWEILDPSNLDYDTDLGLTQDDSGGGPPAREISGSGIGWVRTGFVSHTASDDLPANCAVWTSAAETDFGTLATLDFDWRGAALRSSPWITGTVECNFTLGVWCVED